MLHTVTAEGIECGDAVWERTENNYSRSELLNLLQSDLLNISIVFLIYGFVFDLITKQVDSAVIKTNFLEWPHKRNLILFYFFQKSVTECDTHLCLLSIPDVPPGTVTGNLSVCLSDRPSIHPSIHLSIALQPFVELWPHLSFLISLHGL
jgi:hypothetical protein